MQDPRAGGFGVFGAVSYTPDELETELRWIDDHIDGKPHGLDMLVPENLVIKDEVDKSMQAMARRIPPQHLDFVRELLESHGVKGGTELTMERPTLFTAKLAEAQMDVAFRHPIRLIANALGVPPPSMIGRAAHASAHCPATDAMGLLWVNRNRSGAGCQNARWFYAPPAPCER